MKDSSFDLVSVTSGYIRYSRSLWTDHDPERIWSPETDPDCRAYELLDRIIQDGAAADAWACTCEILRQAPDDELGQFAVGPLEDCVRIHGAALVEAIEAAAAADERLRWALGGIWLSTADLEEAVLRRIVQASGGVLKVLQWIPLSKETDSPSPGVP
jgi:hypothetical protein